MAGSKPFPFMSLPAEIRNEVYEYLIASKQYPHSAFERFGPRFIALTRVRNLWVRSG
jgi:hypothetical protein